MQVRVTVGVRVRVRVRVEVEATLTRISTVACTVVQVPMYHVWQTPVQDMLNAQVVMDPYLGLLKP